MDVAHIEDEFPRLPSEKNCRPDAISFPDPRGAEAGGLPPVTLPFTYCRFDTGNTWLSVPSKTFTEHGHLGELPGAQGD